MKKITLIALLIFTIATSAQEKLVSNIGIINFEASIPSFEEVKAMNSKTTCVLLTNTGEIECWANIKDFKFKRELMQEHFNKNYMESNRFPRAIFKGKIDKFDLNKINSKSIPCQITGKITIRGRTKKIVINGTLRKVNKGIELYSAFTLNTDDFNIEIPFMVRSKISKKVNTQLICVLQ
ncbi:YceI family protein [Flavobacterium glaciei]|uniref:YceI-like domain-containing protein n=1 Tax=Flavobacterium glaciei TaxID=386300 RepID=A0A562Q5A3_9FLAO|nr:YceI family protein [Flavobacterium glaciei]RDI58144.1 YceI-like domain-containing protein [Flavobacterium glaciei]TWI51931.1 YceI-like domain-containing protein [Flavobacterium glaciei]